MAQQKQATAEQLAATQDGKVGVASGHLRSWHFCTGPLTRAPDCSRIVREGHLASARRRIHR